MTDPTDKLLERLGNEPVPLLPPEESEAMRHVLVPRIAAFGRLVAERRRRRARQTRIGAAALVATALLAWGGLRWGASSESATRAMTRAADALGSTRPSEAGWIETGASAEPGAVARLRGGDEIFTDAGGRADVELESGTAVSVGESTTLRLQSVAASELLELSRGHISLDVPGLPSGRSLQVKTPDALVTVHGTKFEVAVQPSGVDGELVTRVTVAEGLVSVQSGPQNVLLAASSSWSSAAEGQASDVVEPASEPRDPRQAPRALAPSGRGDLNVENRLFAAALAAKAAGEHARAAELFDRLIAKHPTSPLLPSARKERETIRRMQESGGSSR